MPLLGEAGITFFGAPESFTPDDKYYLGEAPELRGFWSCGLQLHRHRLFGRRRHALAQWIDEPPSTSGTSISAARNLSRSTSTARRVSNPSACSTPTTGPTASRRPRAVSAARRCTSSCAPRVPSLAKPQAGSAPTGSPARDKSVNTATTGGRRTGSTTHGKSTAPCAMASGCSTCRPLARSGSRAPMPWPSCRRSAPTTSTSRPGASSTPRCSMSVAGSRAT